MTVGPYQGVVLKERYVLDRQIGHGGIGAVYLARDNQLHGKRVVVKVMLDDVSNKVWVLRKFREEIKALARIDHPGVVGALDAGEMPDGKPYIVMQFVEGVPLRKLIEAGGLSFERSANILKQIGHALSAAHESGIIHRDLKPDNVMIQTIRPDEEYIRLIDFGIATVQDPDDAKPLGVTTVAGTVYYMAPEQLEGRPVPASDIYAMGIIAHEMLTGQVPYRPRSPYQLLDMQRQGITNRLTDLNPLIPHAVEASILKALHFDKDQRHTRARDFGDEIARLLLAAIPSEHRTNRDPVGVTSAYSTVEETEIVLDETPPDADVAATIVDDPDSKDKGSGATARLALAAVGGLVVLALIVVGLWIAFGPKPVVVPQNNNATSNANAPKDVPKPVLDRSFMYSVTVQRTRDGQDYKEPFTLEKEVVFEQGYKIRLNLSSPQPGHLYILNEGEPAADGLSSYNILFPSPTANNGSSALSQNIGLQIPGQGWFVLDSAVTTEKVWLIWSKSEIPELEELKALANPVDQGAITRPEQLGVVRRFIADQKTRKPEIERDSTAVRSIVRGSGDVVAHMVPLEHR